MLTPHPFIFLSCFIKRCHLWGLSALPSTYFLQNCSCCHIMNIFCLILFMPCHGVKLLIVFCGFDEHFLCPLKFHPSGPGYYLITGDLLVFLTAVNYLMICLHHCLCHWWNVSLVFCLLLYICIHLPSFWDSPSILQHSYLAFLLACIIARIILSLCVVH